MLLVFGVRPAVSGQGGGRLDTGCWILDAGYSILDAGYWMLDTRYWILDTGCSILDARYWMLDTGCSILDARYWIAGCSIPDIRCRILDGGRTELKGEWSALNGMVQFKVHSTQPKREFTNKKIRLSRKNKSH